MSRFVRGCFSDLPLDAGGHLPSKKLGFGSVKNFVFVNASLLGLIVSVVSVIGVV